MQWSVRINEAYQRLKDPLKRAAYLCELHGTPIRAEDNTAMPAAFLMQQMQWREALEEAAGMAELTGYGLGLNPARRKLLIDVVGELFPRGLDWDQVEFWAGLRPMTPDGPPILGRTRWNNLFLNSGHGSNGWTQSCGTSRIVADIVAGRQPAIDLDGLTAERFHA